VRALVYQPDRRQPELALGEVEEPRPRAGEVLLRVRATALNRADLMQVRGLYPPPPGESGVPGLEAAGEIEALGEGVEGWRAGQRAMALLGGGGHAEKVAVPVGQLLPIPERLSFEQGAAIPEVGVTAWTNLVHEGHLAAGETVLITAAASGVGSFAVQLAHQLGARVLVAGRSLERLQPLLALGAERALLLGSGLPERVHEATAGAGVDLVLDLVGGEALPHHLGCLREGGRLVLIGLLGGSNAMLDQSRFMRRRLRLVGSVLRSRPRPEKARLVKAFGELALPLLADGTLRPVIDRVAPFEQIAEAYRALEEGGVLGKIVLRL